MRYRVVLYVLLLAFSTGVLVTPCSVAAVDAKAVALLKGVEAARTQYDSLRAEVSVEFLSPSRQCLKCIVEMKGNKRRFEVLSSEEFCGKTCITCDQDVTSFERSDNADVMRYDVEYAVGRRGDFSFDPRILGLSDTLSMDHTVADCLGYANALSIDIVGREALGEGELWTVSVAKQSVTMRFSIEEPYFRVHKVVGTWDGGRFEITSDYDASKPVSPFPIRVFQIKEFNGRKIEKRLTITSLDLAIPLSDNRFTLASLELPLNTAIVNYRLMRRIGYWDGVGVSKDPVVRRADSVPRVGQWYRWWLIGMGAAAILCLALFALVRLRK